MSAGNGSQRITSGRAPLLLSPTDAAELMGMHRNTFDRHVRDQLRLVRVGRKVLVPVAELERWVDRNAARTLPEEVR